jgi:hypothetical protein
VHYDDLGPGRSKSASGLDAVHSRHAHVQKHQIGSQLLDSGETLLAGRRLARQHEAGRCLDHDLGRSLKNGLVVDGYDAYDH